jgi:hypothetical protein
LPLAYKARYDGVSSTWVKILLLTMNVDLDAIW